MSTREHKCLLFANNMGIWSYLQYTEYACQHHHNSPHPHQPPPLNTESLLLPSTHGYRMMPGTRYLLILGSSRVVVLRPLQLSDRSRRRKSDKLAGHGKTLQIITITTISLSPSQSHSFSCSSWTRSDAVLPACPPILSASAVSSCSCCNNGI